MVSDEEVRVLTLQHKRARGKKIETIKVIKSWFIGRFPTIKQSYYQGAPIPFPIIGERKYGKTVR
jgi:hypothetical protein